jgi:hypothetical protein
MKATPEEEEMIVTKIAAIAVTAALGLPESASAAWYLTRESADRATALVVEDRYGDRDVTAACRPQRGDPAVRRTTVLPGHVRGAHHRWVCAWAASHPNPDGTDLLCRGTVVIAGSRSYRFQYAVLRGERCEAA